MSLPGVTPKVARSTMGVPTLVNRDWLIEIELVSTGGAREGARARAGGPARARACIRHAGMREG